VEAIVIGDLLLGTIGVVTGCDVVVDCVLFAGAEVAGESGYLGDGDYHYHRVDPVVMVCQHDPKADDVAPRHAWVLRPEVFGEGVSCLADDLQEAFRCELPDPVFVSGVAAEPDDLRDFVGGVWDVGDALVVPAAH
jgi:hypothetical protein